MDHNEFAVDGDTIKKLGYLIVDRVADEFTNPSERPIFPPKQSQESMEDAFGGPVPRQGMDPTLLLEQVLRDLLPASGNPNHPSLMMNVLAGSLPLPALTEALSASIKLRATTWKEQPASCHIEATVVRWMGQLVGYGDDAAGYITTGGAWANLMGMAMARVHKAGWDVREEGLIGHPQLVAYMSQETHSSFEKSAQLMGIGNQYLRKIPVDAEYRIRLDLLEQAIKDDLQRGFKPFCVIGNAGTVSTGAIDPLAALAELAEHYDLWFHVDGAYGGLAALDPQVKPLLRGIEQADSVTTDPHKWLNVPFGAGGILTKSWDHLYDTFHLTPAYIRGMMGDVHNQCEYGFEMSRSDRALKVWLALKQYGADQYAKMITEHNSLARYLADLIGELEEFEIVTQPALSICCFRYVPTDLESGTPESKAYLSRLNTAIEQALVKDGRALVSGTELSGNRVLRACIVSRAVTQESIAKTVDLLQHYGRTLDAEMRPLAEVA